MKMKDKIRALPPSDKTKITVVRACDIEWWEGVCQVVRARCRKAYANLDYGENPYQVGDLRRFEWIEESFVIMRKRLQHWLENSSMDLPEKDLHETGKVLSFNDGKRIVKWNGEYVRI